MGRDRTRSWAHGTGRSATDSRAQQLAAARCIIAAELVAGCPFPDSTASCVWQNCCNQACLITLQPAGPVQDIVWLESDALLVAHAAGFQADTPGTTSAGEWLQEIREDGSGMCTGFSHQLAVGHMRRPHALTSCCRGCCASERAGADPHVRPFQRPTGGSSRAAAGRVRTAVPSRRWVARAAQLGLPEKPVSAGCCNA